MRRASMLMTILAIFGLLTLAAGVAYADGPNGSNGRHGNDDPSQNNGASVNSTSAKASSEKTSAKSAGRASSADKATTASAKDSGGGGKPAPDMTGKSSGPAEKAPPGNNGTIKVHDGDPSVHGDVEVRRNQPHVGCEFHLYGFHFDHDQSGSWEIQEWAPTGDKGTTAESGTWKASAEGDWQSGPIELEEGHYKLFFGTFDGHNKMKVFWVEDCPPGAGPEESPPPGENVSGGEEEEEQQEEEVSGGNERRERNEREQNEEVAGNEQAPTSRSERSEVVCVGNQLMERIFVNESLSEVRTTGAVCVLGVQAPPLVTGIVQGVEQIPSVLGQMMQPILGALPSTSTTTDDQRGGWGLAFGSLAILATGALLLRKRIHPVR